MDSAAAVTLAASKQVGFRAADKSQVALVPVEAVSVLAPCAPLVVFRTLLALDPGSLHSGDHHPDSLFTTDDLLDP